MMMMISWFRKTMMMIVTLNNYCDKGDLDEYLAAYSTPVSLCVHFLTVANRPLERWTSFCCKDNHNHRLNAKLMEIEDFQRIVPKKRATPSHGGWRGRVAIWRKIHELWENSCQSLWPPHLHRSHHLCLLYQILGVRIMIKDEALGIRIKINMNALPLLFGRSYVFQILVAFLCIFHFVLFEKRHWWFSIFP